MKKFEKNQLTRNEMKSVLGGLVENSRHCSSNITCKADEYCADISEETMFGTCKKKEKDPLTLTAKTTKIG
ncbi:hypothetical protein [Mucilaginibacter segetis]|uniref:Uncharacterized protein n=1 Tax=Mucilaginibacter segetis TaxID=2793071 RepID=A0A934PV02_9SPHI|nr:hypothetical protein [Mucilaginibacter segetis]MBK0380549.1 hypothetical protein [Mucilaginibacter segetis]